MTSNLDEVESIKVLKARYCRAIDTKDWELFRNCLTEDFAGEFEGLPRLNKDMPDKGAFQGRDLMIEGQGEFLSQTLTIHQAYMPEITILDDNRATGIWAFRDYLKMPWGVFTGYGHYHEEYIKSDGKWRISRLKTTRISVEEYWN